jgi:hypothetical protein
MKIFSLVLVLFGSMALAAPDRPPKAIPIKPAPAKPAPAAPAPAPSSGIELDTSLKLRIETFFKLLRDGETRDAYDRLFDGSTLAAESPELQGDLIKSTSAVLEKWGKVESASVLRVRAAGATLKEIVCIVNCRKRPIRWKFYAYFGEGRWQIIDTEPSLDLASFFDPEKPAANR